MQAGVEQAMLITPTIDPHRPGADAVTQVSPPAPGSSLREAFRPRIESIDLLRGLLMVLMALDHTRDFFTSAQVDPTDPLSSWPSLFFTRWITHLCAPGFIALAGVSVYLQRNRGKPRPQLMKFLITRGCWLIFLELTLIDFGWFFKFPLPFLQVIWAVGVSMIVLSFLQWLPVAGVGGIGAAIVLFHNLLDPIQASGLGHWANAWKLFHESGMLMYRGQIIGFAFYPVFAWIGVICLGYAFGPLAVAAPIFRRRASVALGTAFLIAFWLLRLHAGYGDKYHWHPLAKLSQSTMFFFEVQKYPPSLEYVLATFGVLLFLYAAFDQAASANWLPRLRAFFDTFGRVPFFYYVLHIYLIHATALLLTLAMHGDWHLWIGFQALTGENRPHGWGLSLPGIYCLWLAFVLALYPPCLWYCRLKARRKDWWLSYL
jgi:uncharacterized membrane protein